MIFYLGHKTNKTPQKEIEENKILEASKIKASLTGITMWKQSRPKIFMNLNLKLTARDVETGPHELSSQPGKYN